MKKELRAPLYRQGDVVNFWFSNGRKEWLCRGMVCVVDIFRNGEQITGIEYDIEGYDYASSEKKCIYKHIDEKCIVGRA